MFRCIVRSAPHHRFSPGIRVGNRLHSPTTIARLQLPTAQFLYRHAQPHITAHSSKVASFHSTARNHGPLIPILASIFKYSMGFELARTASRVVLTFFPLLMFKNIRSRKMIKYAAIHGIPTSEEQKEIQMNKIRRRTRVLQILLAIPFLLFWSTVVASLERTPLTGRWRMILLSPEEEDEIAAKLAGQGWYSAVGEILAEEGSPRAIPLTDWRYKWVYDTLRRLEMSLPILAREPELCPNWMERGEDSRPLPPPAEHPLRPRPRASEYLRWVCNNLTKEGDKPALHGTIPGAPYSLILIDKPESSNAFSYGFGPDGGSGIVVYSGFLDDILAKLPVRPDPSPTSAQRSIWSSLFGGFSLAPQLTHLTPTEEQTAELAILLAHEMAHLILSHHLESLSSVNVIVPGTLSIAADVIRVLLFPFTMIFGPFVNDAVAQLGKVGSGELIKITEACNSTKQEIEADVVSARLLAHAGFDARDAVTFWEQRSGPAAECGRSGRPEPPIEPAKVARQIMGASHPVSELRVNSLKDELARWEIERQKAILSSSTNSSQHHPR